jgi:predicted metal-dependent phosphoesterase TrpH
LFFPVVTPLCCRPRYKRLMRCDLHVHTRHSGMCTLPLLRRVCRESYNDPLAVYEKLKHAGMDLVTITDHDSIDAVESLRSRPDFFLSEEVTRTLPSGTELHVGVYDITERDHVELQRRRKDFDSLFAWLIDSNLFFSANHVFSSLTGSRTIEDFALFERAFPAIETRNGHMAPLNNRAAAMIADRAGCAELGGSDAHAMASVGTAWTTVPGARNRLEYLDGLRHGRGRVRGHTGSWYKLTRDVLAIGCGMMREDPRTLPIAALVFLVPLITLSNCVAEAVFVHYWLARYLRSNPGGDRLTRIDEARA